ncbi:leucine-rich repeat domain-containing protein [Hymenobacter agri]
MVSFIRINCTTTIDKSEIESELNAGKQVIVQFVTNSYTAETLSQLNELCSKHDKNLCVRFYGHYHGSFNCTVLLQLPAVKCLYIDCHKVEHVDALSALQQLEELDLSIFELNQPEILASKNFKRMQVLGIGETRTNNINLQHLHSYASLIELRIANQTKHIDTVGELSKLESLYLYRIKKTPLEFVNSLIKLKRLDLILGSRDNINEIANCSIQQLQLVQVRGFNDLGDLSRFAKLKKLVIENQIQLRELNFPIKFAHLEYLSVLDCKTFDTLIGLINLPALASLVLYNTKIEFDQFIQQELPSTLQHLGFYTGKSKTDLLMREALHKRGYTCN